MLRDFLTAAGLDAKDLAKAIEESRAAVRGVEKWAAFGVKAAAHIAQKAKPGSLVHKGAVMGQLLGEVVESKAGEMLGRKKK